MTERPPGAADAGAAGVRPRRDVQVLAQGLTDWLTHQAPGGRTTSVASVRHASAGLSNETLVVELASDERFGEGPRLVVRLPPVEPSFPEYDLAMQAQVQTLVAGHGIPAPVPVTYEDDAHWLGAPFLVMPFVERYVPGPVPAFDPWVIDATPEEQRSVHHCLIDVLADLHRIEWSAGSMSTVRGAGGALPDELEWWQRYLLWAAEGDPDPGLVDALSWCRDHCPDTEAPASLLWGDARLGNLIFTPDRQVRAVLDWELASLGPAEMDLGWYLGLDSMMFELFGRAVPGFPARAETIARYEERLGRSVQHLEWHEVFALLRALAVHDRQVRMARSPDGGVSDSPPEASPMLAVLTRRVAEATL
jgi:aminoglycoside phosphotransferase (APT) family kinase protein